MTSLTDLFNPTFLMFLGILVLVVALIVVYFESKMREQNHKINSMFSIVSTLAEDMTGMKMGINQIAGTQFLQPANKKTFYQPLEEKRDSRLITVSDDDDDDNDDDNDDDSSSIGNVNIESVSGVCIGDSEEELSFTKNIDDDLEEEISEDDVDQEQIKVFKLNISKEEEKDEEDDDDDEEDDDDDEEESNMEEFHSDNDLDDLDETTPIDPVSKIDTSELKTISINLEEPVEKIDYKKLQLPKLKSIVVEKGLATSSDASKLKKAELLKLLGIE
jgi:hypothetical protein